MLKDRYDKILVFDTETTGLNYKHNQIIEFGAVLLNLNKNISKYEFSKEISILIKSDEVLPKKIVELTGITDDMLLNEGISKDDFFKLLESIFTDNTLFVAYNTQFDISFITEFFRKNKGNKEMHLNIDLLDILSIYRDRHKYPHKLVNALEKYNITLNNSHRALDDAKATMALMRELAKEEYNIEQYVNKFGYYDKYGVSGERLPRVEYIPQYGGCHSIEKTFYKS